MAKLTEAAVREIRDSAHLPVKDLAQKFGVSRCTVYSVRRGDTWSQIDGDRRAE